MESNNGSKPACQISDFEHNKSIFSLGQCHSCYSRITREGNSNQQREQDRKMFAMAAMQGLLSNGEYMKQLECNYRNKVITDMNNMLIRESLDMADQLLKQLES